MACIEEIECLGEFCSCGNINTGIISPFGGVIKMYSEFNGTTITKNIDVAFGNEIVIPNVFNDNYTHVVRFYFNGELVNDLAYSIKIVPCISVDNNEPMANDYSSITLTVSVAGTSITDERIEGNLITGVIINDKSKNKGFAVVSDTITFNDTTTLNIGDKVTLIFQ